MVEINLKEVFQRKVCERSPPLPTQRTTMKSIMLIEVVKETKVKIMLLVKIKVILKL